MSKSIHHFHSGAVLVVQRFIVLAFASVVLFLWTGLPLRAQADEKMNNSSKPADAAKLFDDNCAKCHGKDGRAKSMRGKMVGARNLTDAKWQEKATDAEIIEAIKKGPGSMPAFEKKLSQEEIESLVAYVRHFKDSATKSSTN